MSNQIPKDQILSLIGSISFGSAFTTKMRSHQGWWRAFVLCEEPGKHPHNIDEKVCNTIENGIESGANFYRMKREWL